MHSWNKNIGAESALEKPIFSTMLFFQKKKNFLRKLREVIFGEHDYFWEVAAYYDKN